MCYLALQWQFYSINESLRILRLNFWKWVKKNWSPGLPDIGSRKSWDFLILKVSASTGFSLKVDHILALRECQGNHCTTCRIELLWAYQPKDTQQFSIDRLDNSVGHIHNNVRLTCLECNRKRGAAALSAWEPHPEKAECPVTLRGVPPWQNHLAAHPAGNTTQAHQAWSPSAPADIYPKRPHGVSRVAPTTLQLAALVEEANPNSRGELLLLETNRAVKNYRGGLHGLGFEGVGGLFASQPGHFAIQSGYDARQPSHPLCWPLTRREAHLLSILVSKEPLSQDPVPALHDALVPMNIDATVLNLDSMFGKQLAHRTHELTAGVNLKELRPPQGAPLVNPSQAIGHGVGQRAGDFVAAGAVADLKHCAVKHFGKTHDIRSQKNRL